MNRIGGGCMICPACKNEIADGSIICPICNTQFAFNAPGIVQNTPIVNNNPLNNNVNVQNNTSAYSPNENVMPTEVSHFNEEEIDPSANAMKYVQPQDTSNEEYMHIHGRQIDLNEPYNPNAVSASPLRPEAPISSNNMAQEPIIPQVSPNIVNTNVNVQPTPTVVPVSPVVNPVNQGSQVVSPINTPAPNVIMINNQEEKKKIKKEDIFFGAVSVIGLILFIIIAVSLLTGNKNNGGGSNAVAHKGNVYDQTIIQTDNVGNRSTFNYPMYVGDTTLASIFDTLNQQYVDVDVKGIRFIEGTEAEELAKNYAKEPLIEGFTWYAFEYQVKFNDLKTLTGTGISPVLNSKVYLWSGCDFVTYNEKNYSLNSYTAYSGGPIANTQSATIKVVYQMPASEEEYSICFGYLEKTMGCFAKKKM